MRHFLAKDLPNVETAGAPSCLDSAPGVLQQMSRLRRFHVVKRGTRGRVLIGEARTCACGIDGSNDGGLAGNAGPLQDIV